MTRAFGTRRFDASWTINLVMGSIGKWDCSLLFCLSQSSMMIGNGFLYLFNLFPISFSCCTYLFTNHVNHFFTRISLKLFILLFKHFLLIDNSKLEQKQYSKDVSQKDLYLGRYPSLRCHIFQMFLQILFI